MTKNKLNKLPSNPLVTIVTTCYNSDKYIEECIESVLAQDYKNIEHIIQDADSNQKTQKILNKYRKAIYNNRIKIYSQKDKGQVDGLNKAFQKINGDIFLVLNSDDQIMPYAVSWAVENYQKNPDCGVICGDTYFIDEESEITGIFSAGLYNFEKMFSVELVPPAQATYIRTEAYKNVGLMIDQSIETCPDFDMLIRLGLKYKMKHVFGVGTKYRVFKVPQLDSKRVRTIERFVEAKKHVIDREINNPKNSKKIKYIRNRAYSGLYYWAYQTALSLDNR